MENADRFSDTTAAVCDRLQRHLAGSTVLGRDGKQIDIAELVESVYIYGDDEGSQFWFCEEPDSAGLFEIYLKGHDLERRYPQFPSFEDILEIVLKKFEWQLIKP